MIGRRRIIRRDPTVDKVVVVVVVLGVRLLVNVGQKGYAQHTQLMLAVIS